MTVQVPDDAGRPLSGPTPPRTPLLGRDADLRNVLTALADARLLTLTGTGGTGKTRLAVAAYDNRPAGTRFWVELSDVRAGDLVADTVAAGVGVAAASREPPVVAAASRLSSSPALLVLDNCEHVLSAAADVVDALLDRCPELQVLATSREPLAVSGERMWPVPPLAVPPAGGEVALSDVTATAAAQLFEQRVRMVDPDFRITEQNAADVARLCRRLAGLPLAIELAAARARVLSVAQIVAGLDDMFRVLDTTASRGQRTLRATLDWSHALLTDRERAVFRRLAVFPGGFDLGAACAVAAGPDVPAQDVLDVLSRLVDKSLVVVRRRDGGARYRLLQPVRSYAAELLATAGEAPQAGCAHLEHYCGIVERTEPLLVGAAQAIELDRLETEGNNLRAALAFARDHGETRTGVRLAAALGRLCALRGHYTEGRYWLDWAATVDPDAPPLLRAKALRNGGLLAHLECDYAAAVRRLEAALQIYEAEDEQCGAAEALQVLGSVAREQGRYARAETLHRQSLELYRAEGDDAGQGRSHNYLSFVAWLQGDWDTAVDHGRRALAAFRNLGEPEGTAWALINLGAVAQYQGDSERACELLDEALQRSGLANFPEGAAWAQRELGLVALRRRDPAAAESLLYSSLAGHRSLGDRWQQASVLDDLAAAALGRNDPGQAARLLGAAARIRDEIGSVVAPCERADHDRGEQACRAALGPDRFASVWAAGRDGALDDVLTHRSTPDPTEPVEPAPRAPAETTPGTDPASLRIRVLGASSVQRDGAVLPASAWGWAKPRELMFLLVVHRGLTKDQIGLALWPELGSSELRNAFHTALRDLRRALGNSGWIVHTAGRYSLDRSRRPRCDLDVFESALRAAREARPAADALPHLQRALAVYRGDLLGDFGDPEWVLPRRAELRREYAMALAGAARLLSASGRCAEALELYQRAVDHDPLDETAHRRLMRCLADLGEPGKAALVYRHLSQRLHDELGVAPAPDTTAIYRQLHERG
jgi:predicted ATPase/DNA-binding SARP family transcriptional activator